MLTRRFGRTELEMPVFSCGGMRYQFRWQDVPQADVPEANQRNLEATIERAVEVGIRHIETARGYGSSERQLGQILPRFPREQLIVQTKIGPNADPKQFERDFLDSLARLRLDYVDLLAVHGVNSETDYTRTTRSGGCFDMAESLRKRGLCRFVGVSTHGSPGLVKRLVAYEGTSRAGFDYINLHWYFIFQRNWEAIQLAKQRDLGVFIISPSDKGGKLYAPPQKLVDLCAPLSPMVFNDLFCLSRPEVHTLSIGAARPSDFDEHLKTLPLIAHAERNLAPILERLAASMRAATGVSDPEAFLPGLPPWEQTFGRYRLSIILWLLNLVKGWDLVDYAKMRFNLLGSGDSWFPGERPRSSAEIDDAALIRSLGDYPDAATVPARLREAMALLLGADVHRLSK
jgi:uncharacterized protein